MYLELLRAHLHTVAGGSCNLQHCNSMRSDAAVKQEMVSFGLLKSCTQHPADWHGRVTRSPFTDACWGVNLDNVGLFLIIIKQIK